MTTEQTHTEGVQIVSPAPVTEETAPEETTTEETTETRIEDPEALWKSHEKYRHENASLRKRLTEAETLQEEARKASLSDQEKALEEAYQRGVTETNARLGQELLQERVIREATGKLVDPEDAVHMLDLSQLDPSKPEEIEKAIDELVKAKPHLAAGSGSYTIDQGPRGRMVPAGEDADDWLRKAASRR